MKNDLFRINVGYIAHQTIGYSRQIEFDAPALRIAPDLDLSDFSAALEITRTAQGLLLQAKMRAKSTVECVRCLDEFQQQLEIDFTELYAFNADSATDSGLILPENGWIDLTPLVRDEMLLAFPMNALCSPDCKGLCPVCGANRNHEPCEHVTEQIDPRLEILKSLLDEGENP